MDRQIAIYRERLRETLSPSRFEHSLSVSFTSAALAMCHDFDIGKAEIAGILHDCAKCYDDQQLAGLCRQNGISLTEEEIQAPAVIHAKYGAWMAEHEYGIADPEILEAVLWHTTGCSNMKTLDKILSIAPYIASRIIPAAILPSARKMAFHSLDAAMYEIFAGQLVYLNNIGNDLVFRSQQAYE